MKAIWIDDEWVKQDKRYGGPEALTYAYSKITGALKGKGIDVEWKLYSIPGDAITAIDRKNSNFKLAVIDISYLGQDSDLDDVLNKVRQKNIYYIVFSNYVADYQPDNNKYCLGVYAKKPDDIETMVHIIINFFSCPPFRLLHISDLHYEKKKDNAENEKLLCSLNKLIKDIHGRTPVDAVLVSGDIAGKDPLNDLILVREHFKELVYEIIENPQKVFLVPGNHDVIWKDFKNKELSATPYSSFVDFLQAVLGITELASIACWKKGMLDPAAVAEGLSWRRVLDKPKIDVIGLSTVNLNPDEQGMGIFLDKHRDYLLEAWKGEKKPGELRVLLIHHNLFSVLSNSSYDERRIVKNAGTAINTLFKCGCDLIISGHTHRSEVIKFTASTLNLKGYSAQNTVLCLSSGTSGGSTATGDYARNINVIDVVRDVSSGKWQITVTPYAYSSKDWEWEKMTETVIEI